MKISRTRENPLSGGTKAALVYVGLVGVAVVTYEVFFKKPAAAPGTTV